jgi:uncharacterized damage-inducible protein DinB
LFIRAVKCIYNPGMKELFVQLAPYHLWANQLLLATINSLDEAQQQAEVKSSFNSLFKTALHMWDAEAVWWQRMRLQEKIIAPSENFSGQFKDVADGLLHQGRLWQDWVTGCHEHMLQHEFIYYNSKKEKFKQPVFQVLQHMFNHGTFHRGQLVTILRQLGIEKIPQTDFIVWSRKK